MKSDGLYSNFWAGMTQNYYYLRTERYEPIVYGEQVGCHDVAMIHSAVLIDLRTFHSDRLTYESRNLPGYDGPDDDIITFAMSANKSGNFIRKNSLFSISLQYGFRCRNTFDCMQRWKLWIYYCPVGKSRYFKWRRRQIDQSQNRNSE